MRSAVARLIALAFLTSLLLAGCVAPPGDGDDGLPITDAGLFARAEPLWHNPQDFPHPAFGWPTLTNPPSGVDVPRWWNPVPQAEIPTPIAGMERVAGTDGAIPAGAGLAIFGSLVVMPGFTAAAHTIDISDPLNPVVLGEFNMNGRGAVIIPYPDGRLVTVISSSADLHVFDITDPTNPEAIGTLKPERGSHKVGVVPGTPIVYNANSEGGGIAEGYSQDLATGVTEIFDLSDPENPKLVQVFENGYGCHHIYFYNDPARDFYRAYCAGIEVTQIWDTTDPRDPKVIVDIPVHHGNPDLLHGSIFLLAFSHFSIPSQDGSVLIVGDETGGGAAPGCDFHVDLGGETLSGPLGNLWFYDISDETNPQLLGWFGPNPPFLTEPPLLGDLGSPTCTAHHGRLVPDPDGRDLIAMAFYGAGVILVDFTDPANPTIVDQFSKGTDTWEVWHYNGWLITGDLARGMDVLRLK